MSDEPSAGARAAFQPTQALATPLAAGLTELVGVSIRGLAEGVGTLGRKDGEEIGGVPGGRSG